MKTKKYVKLETDFYVYEKNGFGDGWGDWNGGGDGDGWGDSLGYKDGDGFGEGDQDDLKGLGSFIIEEDEVMDGDEDEE